MAAPEPPSPTPPPRNDTFWEHLKHEWRAVVFVAAVIAVAHHSGVSLVRVIDGYAFLLIGNLSGEGVAIPKRDRGVLAPLALAGVIVVEIDQARFDGRYRGRTPLDRCQLLYDLRAIIDAGPALLVVDLDLSPALWLLKAQDPGAGRRDSEALRQGDCEEQLHRLIEKESERVKIVLMKPFGLAVTGEYKRSTRGTRNVESEPSRPGSVPASGSGGPAQNHGEPADQNACSRAQQECWRARSKAPSGEPADQNACYRARKECWRARSKARFGEPDIPVEFGLALRSNTEPCSLVGVARGAWDELMHLRAATPCDSDESRTQPANDASADHAGGQDERAFVDPRVFRGRGGVQVVSLAELEEEDGWRYLGGRIVFVGAAYGAEEDTFITTAGEVYGVEFHAAALLSHLQPLTESFPLTFLADLLFAAMFALVTGVSLDRFRDARSHGKATAGIWGIVFVALATVLLLAAVSLSWWLLRHVGVWSSPVPVTLGMVIDSVTGRWIERSGEHQGQQSSRWTGRRLIPDSLRSELGAGFCHLRKGSRCAAAWGWFALCRVVWLFFVGYAVAVAVCEVWPASCPVEHVFKAVWDALWSALQRVLLFVLQHLGVA